MLLYNQFYMKYGVRRYDHLIKPRWFNKNLEFPKKSMLFWYNPSDIPTTPSKDLSYLSSIRNPYVYTVDEYIGETLGSYRRRAGIVPTKLISNFKKIEPGFTYLRPGKIKVRVPDNSLLIMNHGVTSGCYIYNPNPINSYFKWYNSFSTMIETALNKYSSDTRHKFITFELPSVLPSREELIRYASMSTETILETMDILGEDLRNIDVSLESNNNDYYSYNGKVLSTEAIRITKMIVNRMPTYKHFNVLCLWELLTIKLTKNMKPEDINKDNIFNRIPRDELKNITLMFIYNDRVSYINLYILYSIVAEYKLQSKLSPKPAEQAKKLLYIYMSRLVASDATISDVADAVTSKLTDKVYKDDSTTLDISDIEDSDISSTIDIDDELGSIPESAGDVTEVSDDDTTSADINKALVSDVVKEYKSIQDVKTAEITPITSKLDKLNDSKLVSKNTYQKLSAILDTQDDKDIEIPNIGPVKLKELLTIKDSDTELPKESITLPDNKVILDKTMNRDIVNTMTTEYITKLYRKDLTSVIFAIQNSGNIITDYMVDQTDDILGGSEDHTIGITTLSGKPTILRLKLPIVSDNGEIKLSGNTYRVRLQRADAPIRKISKSEVALSTYYGKLFISKAKYKKDDLGFWLRKQITEIYHKDSNLKGLVLSEVPNIGVELSRAHSLLARYIRSFEYMGNKYLFDYENRNKLLTNLELELEDVEENDLVLIGITSTNEPILIDKNDKQYISTSKGYKEVDNILEQLNIDLTKGPMEYAVLNIYNKSLPVALLLAYYLGFNNMLKSLKVKYSVTSDVKHPVEKDQYRIRFNDGVIIVNRDYGMGDIVLGGLAALNDTLKTISYTTTFRKETLETIFVALELPVAYVNEIRLLETMFVDPISKNILTMMKEPVTFQGLLIRSAELLLDDNYKHPNDIQGMVIKGYERIAGMVYKELVTAIKEHNNRSIFGRSKISLDPYSVWKKINEDSSTVPVDDLNPIATIKQAENVTMLGAGGRSKDTMSKDTRIVHPSDIGIISEATVDSGDVGITAYLSAAPEITNLRGIPGKYNYKENGLTSLLSTTSILLPDTVKDDPKRLTLENMLTINSL